ncbi:hypothetical protein [Cutibacterium sp. V947]
MPGTGNSKGRDRQMAGLRHGVETLHWGSLVAAEVRMVHDVMTGRLERVC